MVTVTGETVVPADEHAGGVDAGEGGAGDGQGAWLGGTVGEDDCVVVG